MKRFPSVRMFMFLLAMLWVLQPSAVLAQQDSLTLALDGKTEYQIVMPGNATPVDEYAVQELRGYLKQITTADFPVIAPENVKPDGRYIFVGISSPVRAQLGDDPAKGLAPQEHVARSLGEHIYLYGEGVHGNLDAVMNFLRESLGWRWYSRFEHPVIPHTPTVRLEPFERKRGYDYTFRMIHMSRGPDWPYQMGANQEIDSWVDSRVSRSGDRQSMAQRLAHFVSRVPDAQASYHTLKAYLPPMPEYKQANRFEVIEKKNYFESHPEWFTYRERSMKRVWQRAHVCFSNQAMRQEMTRNILKVAATLPENAIISLGPDDHGGALCECEGCRALEAKYQTAGGPLVDYLFDLCAVMAREHPGMKVRTTAYRRDQTQRPPVLPEGTRLPDNLIVWFAPINDNYFADWTHPDPEIQRTYADLKRWSQLAREVHLYLYPNPYGSGSYLPVGNVQRFISMMKMGHEAGATGVFLDLSGQHSRSGFSELHVFLQAQLSRDIHQDGDALIKNFTDHMYGPAGELVRRYMHELEAGRRSMHDLPPKVTYRSADRDDRTFPYLTPENLHRWQGYFDLMNEQTAQASDRVRYNLGLLRRELDVATLWKWNDLKEKYPADYTDHMLVVARLNQADEDLIGPPRTADRQAVQNRTPWEIETGKTMNRQARPLTKTMIDTLVLLIEVGEREDPLPAELAGIDPSRIRTFLPIYPNNRPGRSIIKDAKAPFGYAIPVENPDLPFQFGFYQSDTRTHGARKGVELSQIKPGQYQTFKLGTVEITPECSIWFSADSWATRLQLGEELYEPGEDTTWEAYVTLRFDGPTYGSEPDESLLPVSERQVYNRRRGAGLMKDLVLVGRIILVKSGTSE